LIDHEVVQQIAQRLGVEEEDAAAHDEHAESWVMQFLTTMQGVGPMVALPSNLAFPPTEASYTRALRDVVNGAVLAGQTVIVGRGSQIILRDRRDTLHVRIVAPLDLRITYVALRENLTRSAAQQRIIQRDQERRRYLSATYRALPEDPHLYDIILNTSVLNLDGCVDLIRHSLDDKATRLGIPATALGPAGWSLPPYPTAPIDFIPPTDTPENVAEGVAEGSVAPASAPTDTPQSHSGA
jgi:CMP/dCMP kinase